MVSTEEALWRGVMAAPDDGLPKLVLADWFDEHGEPEMAQALRWMAENGKMPFCSDPTERYWGGFCWWWFSDLADETHGCRLPKRLFDLVRDYGNNGAHSLRQAVRYLADALARQGANDGEQCANARK